MHSAMRILGIVTVGWVAAFVSPVAVTFATAQARSGTAEKINLAERLAAGKLRAVNREVTKAQGRDDAVHLDAKPGDGVAWVEGTEFGDGTIELEIRGKDLQGQSFVGVAFHRKDDNTYDAVYLRPFNFRTEDPVRRQHAVQYVAVPDYQWPRLRKDFPEEFENPVDQSVAPTDWVPVRVVAKDKTIQVFVGKVSSPTLEVRKLGPPDRGLVGLWTGNNSDGDFANLRITPAK